MKVSEINTAIIATSPLQYLPESKKVERINAIPRLSSKFPKSDKSTQDEDSIEISSEARLAASKNKEDNSKLISDTYYSSDFSKIYKENFDETLLSVIPKHLRESVSSKNWKAENYVKEIRGGFIISGANSKENISSQNSPENKILARYENENVRLPGHLLSILV